MKVAHVLLLFLYFATASIVAAICFKEGMSTQAENISIFIALVFIGAAFITLFFKEK